MICHQICSSGKLAIHEISLNEFFLQYNISTIYLVAGNFGEHYLIDQILIWRSLPNLQITTSPKYPAIQGDADQIFSSLSLQLWYDIDDYTQYKGGNEYYDISTPLSKVSPSKKNLFLCCLNAPYS